MDRIAGTNYTTVSGKRMFTDGPPGTTLTATWLNGVQEELIRIIEGAGLVPSDADTTQLYTAISGLINNVSLRYGPESGVADAYILTLTPALAAYVDGAVMMLKPGNSNTGASTINVNGLGLKNITKMDGSALGAGDLRAASIHIISYNSTSANFQLLNRAT